MDREFKLGLCQMQVETDKGNNVGKAVKMIGTAAGNGADMVVLPEMFNCPYDNSYFREYAEDEADSETLRIISETAAKFGVYVVAGSIPEIEEDRLYNTSFSFDRKGKKIGKHRKIHLFDIDIKGKIKFIESEVLTAGQEVTVLDTEFCKVGIGICYDMRFPELFRIMALKGAQLIVVPGAFNMVTGPAHWETLIRSRAIDNQVYFAAVSPARDEAFSYIAYGNSMVADPWGNTSARAGKEECILYAPVNLSEVERIRRELPLLKHRRTDIYG